MGSLDQGICRLSQTPKVWQLTIKRGCDILGSAMLLLVLAPLLLAAGILVCVESKGPALYGGQRWGWHQRKFACFKLRTMYINHTEILARNGLTNLGDKGRLLVFERDPRITPIGAILRKLSIDELPQLINVLRGDMSLIGPRPLALSMLDDYPEIREARSKMRPGITGLWQVRHRMKNASVFDMIDDDLAYFADFSLLLDLKILWRTFPRIIEPALRNGEDK